jgi:hypothetical protein
MHRRGRSGSRRVATGLMFAMLALPAPVWPQQHLVDTITRDARLMEHGRAARPRALGFEVRRPWGSVVPLSDSELQDLALRSGALKVDPASGSTKKALIIVAASLVLLAVFVAAGGGCSGGCN